MNEIIIGKANVEVEKFYKGPIIVTQTIVYTVKNKKYKINIEVEANPKHNIEKYLFWFKEDNVIIEHIPNTEIYFIYANH